MAETAGRSTREVKIFVSSPGDVLPERKRLERVTERLNGRLGGTLRFRCVRWEERFYRAHDTFQAQIESAASCELVVSVFWTRLGTELPPDFPERLPDGRPYPSGTAYEVLTALEAARARPLPDVYVFRKTQRPLYPDPDNEAETTLFEAQLKALRGFWEEWFRNRAGQFRAAFNNFGSTDEFEIQIEKLLYEWLAGKDLLGREVRWRIEEQGSPFRGLLPFEASHAEVFFGREVPIERGREQLADAAARKAPFLLVLGASGSGKSSLARAGLVPRLVAPGAVEGVDAWRVARVAPGLGDADPLKELAETLLEAGALPELAETPNGTVDGIARQLSLGGDAAVGLVRWALDRVAEATRARESYDRPATARLLLVADQFEGLFSEIVTEERRAAFVTALDALIRSGLVWTITTMRSTEYALLQADPALLKLKEDGATLDVTPPDAVALAEAIRGPAEAAGLVFERDAASGHGLDAILRADTGGADALPLLQFTLQRLFEEREDRGGVPTLTLEAYRALGGIEGAIAAEAERVVTALPDDAQAQLPWLLRQLVAAGRAGEASIVLREAVLDDAELASHPGASALIEALVAARVLALDADSTQGPRRARLAHEAVLRSWTRAHDFVESNSHYFQQYAALHAALDRWLADDLGRDQLLRGTPLAQAEDLLRDYGAELSPRMREFVLASRSEAGRGRRIAYGIAAVMAVLFVGAVLAGLHAWRQENIATAALRDAQRNYELALDQAAGSIGLLVDGYDQGAISTGLLRQLMEKSQKTVDGLPGETTEVSAARLQLFDALSIANVSVGQVARAREFAEQEIALASALLARDPANPKWQQYRAVADERLAEALLYQGDLEGAVRVARAGEAVLTRLAAGNTADEKLLWEVILTHQRIGDALRAQGDLAGSARQYEIWLEQAKKFEKLHPGNPLWSRAIAFAYQRLGENLLTEGKAAEAADQHRVSRVRMKALAAGDPQNAIYLEGMVFSHQRLGDALMAQDDVANAMAEYEAYQNAATQLANVDASNFRWRQMLVFSYQRIGEVLLRLKKYEDARQAFGTYLSMSEEGRRKDPVHNALLFDVSNAHEKVGDALRGLGKLPEALREYRLQLAIASPLVLKDASNAAWQRNLANSHQRIGLVLKELGETNEALDEFRRCAAISIKKTAWTPRSTWPPDVNDYCSRQVAELGGSSSAPMTGK